MSSFPKKQYTLEEYLELERNSEERYEFWNGEIVAMSGASPEHETILSNLITELNLEIAERPCRAFPSNLRIKVPSLPPYRYADASALSGNPEYELIGGIKALTNPSVIFEILSQSTEGFDRGDKFTFYQSIPSFQEYILIAQHRPYIGQFIKQSDHTWTYSEVNDINQHIHIHSINCTIKLKRIYRNLEFSPNLEIVPPSSN